MGDITMRILIVDDALFMRITLEKILKKADYEVVGQAVNGKEALEAYKNLQPDLVTMDMSMPEMDGIQAVREIKKIDPNAKIIMVSAMGQEMIVRDAIVAGAVDFINKPFKPEKVLQSIGKIANKL
jgi:two-component system chemotaxis response regulator CheY